MFTMRVEDKNIELAITSDSTLLPEADVDDAGLIVRVTGTDKSLLGDKHQTHGQQQKI